MFRLPGNLKLPATVAVFDCGTNSLLLTVARIGHKKRIQPLFEAMETPRLGEGLTGKRNLKSQTVARTLRSLKKLRQKTQRLKPDYSIIVGTNVFRRAANGKAVARYYEKKLRLPFFVLSPSEEARLEFLGAVRGLPKISKVAVIDVGGGSSEIIWGNKTKIRKNISLEIGAVRLKEKFGAQSRYSPGTLPKMEQEALRITKALKPSAGYSRAVLTGGTATTLAAFHLGLKTYNAPKVHGRKLTTAHLVNLTRRLATMALSERRRALTFDPARADIIVPGAVILTQILRKLKIKKTIISHRGLRWGVLYSYFP